MNNSKYVSIKSILYDINRYPFVEGIQIEDVALYLTGLLSLVGSPFVYEKKYAEIEINNFRAPLPCDLIRIDGTMYRFGCTCEWLPLTYASDIYYSDIHSRDCPDKTCQSEYSYSINNGYIYTSFETAFLKMAYQGIVTDEEGFPMIPDNIKFKEALKYYILLQYAEPAYFRGEVNRNIYSDIKQQYAWYVGAASNTFNMPSMDQMKSLENGLIRLFQGVDHHSQGWENFNKREFFKK